MALYPKIHEVMGTYTAYWNSEKHNARANSALRHYCKFVIDTGHYPIIPGLLSSLFWFVMHGRNAFYSYPSSSSRSAILEKHCLHTMRIISHALHHQNIQTKGMGWWGSALRRCNWHKCKSDTTWPKLFTQDSPQKEPVINTNIMLCCT